MVKIIQLRLKQRIGQQTNVTLIPFGCLPAQALNVQLPFSDAALPDSAGCDYWCVNGEMQQDFASDLLFPGPYGEESKE